MKKDIPDRDINRLAVAAARVLGQAGGLDKAADREWRDLHAALAAALPRLKPENAKLVGWLASEYLQALHADEAYRP